MDYPGGHVPNVVVTSYLAFGKEGRVYQAELRDTHLPVAIKCIERWEEKIVSLRKTLDFCIKLDHPNIVRHLYHQACPSINPLEPPVYQVIMELCRGGTLRHIIRRIVVTPILLQKWTKEVVEGLSYLHEMQCVHRDLKGDNILMTSKNPATSSVKIADLSTIASADETCAGYGTYPFMAPEMIADRFPENDAVGTMRGPLADVWSLGCVVIEMLNGTSPQFFREINGEKFQIKGEHAVMYFIMDGGLPTIPAGLPSNIDHFVRGCLKREPCERNTAVQLKSHPFLTCPVNTLSTWVLPERIGELQEPVELQEFSVGTQRIIPVHLIRRVETGRGYVFLAERTDTGDIVAVKSILLDVNPEVRKRKLRLLKTELRILMPLHHPNIVSHIHHQEAPIVSVYDPPTYQILMEFCEGPTLLRLIRETTVPIPLLHKWTKQLVDGIFYLHSQNCVHRNLALSTILLSSSDMSKCTVKICGFGMITRLTKETTNLERSSISASIRDTIPITRYMSPEVILYEARDLDSRIIGKKCDIWSLGCIVIALIIGKEPQYHQKGSDGQMREINSHMSIMHFVGTGGLPTVPVNLPEKIDDFIKQCIQWNSNDRPRAVDLKGHGFLTAVQDEVSRWANPP